MYLMILIVAYTVYQLNESLKFQVSIPCAYCD